MREWMVKHFVNCKTQYKLSYIALITKITMSFKLEKRTTKSHIFLPPAEFSFHSVALFFSLKCDEFQEQTHPYSKYEDTFQNQMKKWFLDHLYL